MPLTIGCCAESVEIHNGLAIQMIDEVRHSTIQMNLKRLYMNHYVDPAGFDISEKGFSNCYAGTIGRQFGEGFITGDAITAANIYLTIVAETAFTNVLFVAMPGEAAANGDYLLPTVFHSVQSDESRHISNGYSIILMALADERNRQLLQRDLRYAWWNNHAVVDAAIGTFIEYGTRTAARTASPMPRCGGAGSTTTTTGPTSSRSRSTADDPHDLVEEPGTGSGTRATSTRWRSSSPPGGSPTTGGSTAWTTRLRVVRAQVPGLVRQVRQVVGALRRVPEKNGHKPIAFEPAPSTSTRTAAGAAWCRA